MHISNNVKSEKKLPWFIVLVILIKSDLIPSPAITKWNLPLFKDSEILSIICASSKFILNLLNICVMGSSSSELINFLSLVEKSE